MVESQPSKLLVAGSIPVSRSSSKLENRNSKIEGGSRRISICPARLARGGPM